jgi:hypothetical protein
VAGFGDQKIENREPQNIEQGISNDEVFFPFDIHYSLFDIRYLKQRKVNAAGF